MVSLSLNFLACAAAAEGIGARHEAYGQDVYDVSLLLLVHVMPQTGGARAEYAA